MTRRIVIKRYQLLASRALVELHDNRGVGEVDAYDRALAAATHIAGTDGEYEAFLEDEPA